MRLSLVRHVDIILDILSCSNRLLITSIDYFYNYLGYIPCSALSFQRFPSTVTSIFLHRSLFFAFSSFQWFIMSYSHELKVYNVFWLFYLVNDINWIFIAPHLLQCFCICNSISLFFVKWIFFYFGEIPTEKKNYIVWNRANVVIILFQRFDSLLR